MTIILFSDNSKKDQSYGVSNEYTSVCFRRLDQL